MFEENEELLNVNVKNINHFNSSSEAEHPVLKNS